MSDNKRHWQTFAKGGGAMSNEYDQQAAELLPHRFDCQGPGCSPLCPGRFRLAVAAALRKQDAEIERLKAELQQREALDFGEKAMTAEYSIRPATQGMIDRIYELSTENNALRAEIAALKARLAAQTNLAEARLDVISFLCSI
jgi:uncharacterized small protein (DUF1192 family)